MRRGLRSRGTLAAVGVLFSVGSSTPVWAKSFGKMVNVDKAVPQGAQAATPQELDKIREDQQKIKNDLDRIKQHREAFRKQLAGLEARRKQALKAKNAEQTRAIEQEIEQLREKGPDPEGDDRFRLIQDKRQLHKDKD